ncbi:hypothetical protein [Paraglaciecola arctica]|uniref:Lipoprotein n=1 Tax=Paraglaciecola arctica BSs20135 TaxID=493475 RepID=K6YS43_9ALTE|nr:hypothetical protein [Paraglaciecola arctica]GAC20982.1 hypothetical protein GARC_4035 [Paraglaciecola arctica BSs20135]
MSKFKKCTSNNVIYGLTVLLIWVTLSGCMQSNAATTDNEFTMSAKPQKLITDNTLKVVNAAFYSTFILGEWRYKGAKNLRGKINAYIQIPAPLEMSKEVQKSYLRTAICPSSAHKNMWNEIDGIPLSIHIYTHGQRNSLYVDCINPFITG